MNDLALYIFLIGLLLLFISNYSRECEQFYDWQTAPVDADLHEENSCALGVMGKCISFPHYIHDRNHQMFLNPNHVGCGSCIYSKDSQNDNVLQDGKCTRQLMTKWDSPPINEGSELEGPKTSGCLCDLFH